MDNVQEAVVVAVRVRPLTIEENKENAFSVVQQLPGEGKILSVADKGFAFDYIFTEECEQISVYKEAVKPAVDRLCMGYNCAVIAYGHTGTGKTYTIGTDPKKCFGKSAGIISRAVEDVLSGCDDDVTLEISFMEIYNEDVYDLLTSQPTKLHVQAFCVQNLSHVKVDTFEEAIHQLEVGSSNRHTRTTKLNAHSSRSHAIFTIYRHKKLSEEKTLTSRLDLVDLAGSEGVRHTGSKGVALIEANKINHGLLNLRNVISILSSNSKDYVPYRSSTLTTVLKDSLNRGSFVTMIACISPSNLDVAHTIISLRFIEEAKKVMNKPKVNQIVEKFKAANPQAFEAFVNVTSLIPPTPRNRELYRIKHSPAYNTYRPLSQLNNQTSFSSSVDLHDSMWKHRIPETPSNCSLLSTSNTSSSRLDTSSILPDMASVLSPLLRKHLQPMQAKLEENLNNTYTFLMSQKKSLASPANTKEHNDFGSPVDRESNVMKILSVTERTERHLRNEMRSLKAELKTYVEKEIQRIHQLDASCSEDSRMGNLKKVKRTLSFTGKKSNEESPSSDDEKIHRTTLPQQRRLTRSSARFLHSLEKLNISNNSSLNNSNENIQVSEHVDSEPYVCTSTPDDEHLSRNLSCVTTVRETRKKRNHGEGESSPDSRTLRKSARWSKTKTMNNIDTEINCCGLSTVKKPSIGISVTRKFAVGAESSSYDERVKVRRSARLSTTCTRVGSSPDNDRSKVRRNTRLSTKNMRAPLIQPSEELSVRKIKRLQQKPKKYYNDKTPSPLLHINKTRRISTKSTKPVLAASPMECLTEGTSTKLKERFRLKVLKLLNGSLRDLTQLATVGAKTALIIYNYRLLNDCKFENLEDLKMISGLPVSYYDRFMKGNNLF